MLLGYLFSEHADSAQPRNLTLYLIYQTLSQVGALEGLGKRLMAHLLAHTLVDRGWRSEHTTQ